MKVFIHYQTAAAVEKNVAFNENANTIGKT